jgi:hypothetical protein
MSLVIKGGSPSGVAACFFVFPVDNCDPACDSDFVSGGNL